MERPSPLRSMMRLVARGVRARGAGPEWELSGPRRKVAVERAGILVDAAQARAYVRATAGEGIAAFRSPDSVAPPFYPATWELGLVLEMFAGLENPLPLGPMVHASTEMTWVRPIRPGETVRCRVELDRVERVRRGLRFTVLARNWLGGGQLCC
ncbi:MAG TPA: MaoC family dehydratase N-terminal domain-containing protein, partial [Longimicrobium sp.]|nr:MaoC family dehydratase N-terminal domain-containing protein [Longimicrobium sp.]